jgi:hypothetical protein
MLFDQQPASLDDVPGLAVVKPDGLDVFAQPIHPSA